MTKTQGPWGMEMRPGFFNHEKEFELSAGTVKECWNDFKKSCSMCSSLSFTRIMLTDASGGMWTRGDEAGHRGNYTGQDEPDSCLEQADPEGLGGEERMPLRRFLRGQGKSGGQDENRPLC